MRIVADAHDLKNEGDNEANEQKELHAEELPCIRIPFKVYDDLDRLSFKDHCIFLNEVIQHLSYLSMIFIDWYLLRFN